ncbi:MltA domain-containing protein [uncultured Roseobacter sp.]|uniref:murein transglycosylase A n=1 Tax=uncultured Roseobacter sp. TaxID=114847 RepID=UPI0026083667|nr:MltA domain-containing protein [uncultured Roseobacter sp.]
MAVPVAAEVQTEVLTFAELDGWADDDHAAAFDVFRSTCADMKDPDWQAVCAFATSEPDPRQFFELLFRPVLITDGADPLFTGYFEPELRGARQQSGAYRYPVYAMPPEARAVDQWYSRRELLETGKLAGRGLEIAWVDDPVELFFLQIQGSGRISLPDGGKLRVGYGGANGHPYRSIGAELVRRGTFQPHQVSATVIRNWVRDNPVAGKELLFHNPSYVFFREVSKVPAHKGPLGAMNRSVTPMRSIAVDPAFVPLGAPVWVEKDGADPLRRLMIAQDTGSAIKGAQRADVFFGTGDAAGRAAGQLKDPGRMVVLLPTQRAWAMAPENGL